MENPRLSVTVNVNDYEVLRAISKERRMSLSNLGRKIIENWIENYTTKVAEEIEEEEGKHG